MTPCPGFRAVSDDSFPGPSHASEALCARTGGGAMRTDLRRWNCCLSLVCSRRTEGAGRLSDTGDTRKSTFNPERWPPMRAIHHVGVFLRAPVYRDNRRGNNEGEKRVSDHG